VDFTAHVIGFDVAQAEDQKGLRCLAENTGGKFIAAANAEELKTALEQTAKAPTPTAEPAKSVTPSLPKATLHITPAEVIKGAEISIQVEGDADMLQGANIHLNLYKVGKNVSIVHYYLYKDKKTGAYKTQKMRVPNVAGDFVVKLTRGNQRELIAEAPVKVTEADIQLLAPSQAASGSKIQVTLQAPLGLQGEVCLYPQQGSKRLDCEVVREDAIENYRPMRFTLPELAGAYVFKFEAKPDKRIAAELPIQVGTSQP
jgi:Ca-activated chloride channel family protein